MNPKQIYSLLGGVWIFYGGVVLTKVYSCEYAMEKRLDVASKNRVFLQVQECIESHSSQDFKICQTQDPWGNKIKINAIKNKIILHSLGKDQQENTDDDLSLILQRK